MVSSTTTSNVRGSNSPIEWIPVELLKKIFFYCLPDPLLDDNVSESDEDDLEDDFEDESDEPDYLIRPSRTNAPLLLTEVSKGWRKIALSTPELWCSVKIDLHIQHEIYNADISV